MKGLRHITNAVLLIFFTAISGLAQDIELKKEDRNLSGFDRIILNGEFDVRLTQGETEKVVVEAHEKVLPIINTKVYDGVLKINSFERIRRAKVIRIYITVKDIKSILVMGTINLFADDVLKFKDLELTFTGLSNSRLDIEAEKLSCFVTGASDVVLSGKAEVFDLKVSDEGLIDAFEFEPQICKMIVTGIGDVSVNVMKELEMVVTGEGNVYYTGEPEKETKIVSGSGFIIKKRLSDK